MSKDQMTPEQKEAAEAEAFDALFSPSCFAAEPTRFYMLLSRDALLEHYRPEELVQQAKGRAAGTGKFDDHPFIEINPELSLKKVAAVMDNRTKEAALAAASAAQGQDVEEDTAQKMASSARMLAAAVTKVGGDWRVYANPFEAAAAKQMVGWDDLQVAAQVDLLMRLTFREFNRLSQALDLKVSEDDLGN